ncbi:site-specific integrase [Emcibacteraceae bacterium]|nr:site-specific integrase [Emcibacteraceae bacterium]
MGRFLKTTTPYLYSKDGIFYYRRRLPTNYAKHLNLSEVRRSLRTGNIEEARLKCAYVDIRLKGIIGETEQLLLKNVTPSALKIARDYFENELEDLMDTVEFAPSLDDDFNPGFEASDLPEAIKSYQQMAVLQQFSPALSYDIDQSFEREGRDIPPVNSDRYREVGVLIARAKAEILRIYNNHLLGLHNKTSVEDPFFIPAKDVIYYSNPNLEEITLEVAIKRHQRQKREEVAIGTHQDYERVFKWMLEWFGEETILQSVNITQIRNFKNTLMEMPKNYKKLKKYRNLDIRKVVDKSKKFKNVELASYKTQHKYFSLMKSFFQWTINEGYLEASPAANIKMPKRKKDPTSVIRKPFTREELETLLHSPLFSGYASVSRRYIEGRNKKQLADYWVWLLGLFAGLRVKEIVLLHRRDIIEQDGILCISVNDDHGKGIKTDAGSRLVPIHSTLLDLGFMDWVHKTTRNRPNKYVFPMLISESDKDPSKRATRRTTPYLRKIGIEDPSKVFHSTRHTFSDELRNSNLEYYSIKKLMGHSSSDVTSIYGTGASISMLKEYIDKCYGDVDFAHLKQMRL